MKSRSLSLLGVVLIWICLSPGIFGFFWFAAVEGNALVSTPHSWDEFSDKKCSITSTWHHFLLALWPSLSPIFPNKQRRINKTNNIRQNRCCCGWTQFVSVLVVAVVATVAVVRSSYLGRSALEVVWVEYGLLLKLLPRSNTHNRKIQAKISVLNNMKFKLHCNEKICLNVTSSLFWLHCFQVTVPVADPCLL